MKSIILSLVILFGITVPCIAHHSTNAIYHEDQTIEITGTVISWRFINPHPYLVVEVLGEDGSLQEWDISFGGSAVTHLKRRGYSAETFMPGDEIIFRGNPAKAQDAYGLLVERENPRRADGSPLL